MTIPSRRLWSDLIKAEGISSYITKSGRGILFPSDAKDVCVSDLFSLQVQGLNNKMYVVPIRYHSENRQLKKLLVFRICEDKHAQRLVKEYRALKALKAHGIPVPTGLILETDQRIIGAPFIIMEKITGESASNFLDSNENALLTVDLLAKLLASLHKLQPEILFQTVMKKNSLEEASEFRDSMVSQIRHLVNVGYITGLSPFARRRYLTTLKKLKEIEMQPCRLALVHCDYGPDHVLLTRKGPVITDWEGIRSGDPAYDVGWVYHIIRLEGQAMIDHRFVRTPRQGSVDLDLREEFVKCYEKYAGSRPANLEFYKALVALRLATVLDLEIRPGFFFLSRVLRLRPQEVLSQTVLAYNTIKSFKEYCDHFLQKSSALSNRLFA